MSSKKSAKEELQRVDTYGPGGKVTKEYKKISKPSKKPLPSKENEPKKTDN